MWVVDNEDSRLMLSDGQWYDDWASALGANTLGYSKFFYKAEFKPATSLPWQSEHDFAEEFCDAMGTKAVRFFKSGSDAVSCAVRLARAFTERDYIIMFDQCYHGTASEFKPIAWQQAGYPEQPAVALPFGEELRSGGLIGMGKVAAVVLEPVPKAIDLPPECWLEHLREVCDKHGIILIFDQIILGYRHTLAGYPGLAGVQPDLSCYGKAMAQGAALSACTGRYDTMSLLKDQVHFSGTNNGEPLPLQIAQWTLKEYQEKDVCFNLKVKGRALKLNLLDNGFETRGLDSRFEVVFDSPEAKASCVKFCFDRNILFPGFCSMAVSHTPEQMARLVQTLVEWRTQCP